MGQKVALVMVSDTIFFYHFFYEPVSRWHIDRELFAGFGLVGNIIPISAFELCSLHHSLFDINQSAFKIADGTGWADLYGSALAAVLDLQQDQHTENYKKPYQHPFHRYFRARRLYVSLRFIHLILSI